MSETDPMPVGSVSWFDLTVDDADGVRDFYQAVVGWEPVALSMGDYNDYCMNTPAGATVAGVCHARGGNAGLPAQWLLYITVADLDHSVAEVERRGGKLLTPVKGYGEGRYCIIQDPAGAVAALYSQK
jgi:predicted enzyme related to lactoylglutathione lyase